MPEMSVEEIFDIADMLDSEFYPQSRREAIEEQVDKAAADKGMDRNVPPKNWQKHREKVQKEKQKNEKAQKEKERSESRRDGLMRKNRQQDTVRRIRRNSGIADKSKTGYLRTARLRRKTERTDRTEQQTIT